MRLKHLQLQGYKTFATKTEFLFPSGITAVVGPNGSGKSNIADAMRWVLGEQSYTALRGKRTEDMIFSGSQSRSRAGMAEVTLTLDNSDGWLPIDFSEVTVSRRAYRDGQNEYRINNNRVRLRDILELLSQSGLSRRTYTLIGQGVVDSVLSLRAQERRTLFEEAAGITHYRDKREDALRKLDETQHNMARVHDIMSEIEPRLKRLQQQAERTREHKELSAHLERLLRTWYGYRWGQTISGFNQAQRIARRRAEQHEKRVQRLQELANEIDQKRQAQSDLRSQLGDWHRQSSALHAQAEEGQRELAVLAERSRQLATQREEQVSEIATLDARVAAQTERVMQAQAELAAAQLTVTQRENEAQEAQAAFDTRMSEREALLQARRDTQDRSSTLRAEIAEHQSRWETLSERVETLVAQAQSDRDELARLNQALTARLTQIAQVDTQLAQLGSEQEKARQRIDDLENQRRALAEQLEHEQARLRRLREEEADVNARFELLSQLRRDFAVYGQATRALLTVAGSNLALPGIKGVLAQMIHVSNNDGASGLSTAVEAALGAYAGAVVVTDWRTAANALRHLRSSGVPGRVILLALEPATVPPAPFPQAKRSTDAAPLSASIQCDDALRPLVDRLLSQAYLVPDLETAHSKLPNLFPGAFCVTPEGDVLRNSGVIEGGQPGEQTSPLAQEREWSQLNTRRIELGARRETLEADVTRLNTSLKTIQEQLAQSNVALDDVRARRTATSATHDQLTRQTDRLRQEIGWRQSQIESAEADQQALRQRLDELTSQIKARIKAQTGAEGRIQELAAQLETLPTQTLNDDLTAAQMALAAARQTQQGRVNILRELENSLTRLEQERETRRLRLVGLQEDETRVTERVAQLTRDQADLASRLEASKAQIEPTEARLATLENQQRQVEAQERLERTRLREFEGHLTNARLEMQRREDELEQLRSRIEEDLGLVELELGPSISGQTPLPLHPLVSKLPVVQELPEGADDEIKRLRAQLRRLGAINPNAPEDYKEALERYNFLQEQSSDLMEASDSLRKVITEMDGLIEHAFRQTFEAVASEFIKNFKTLFGGGQARLELTDPDDLAQTGVEIVAQPPGKRLQALASLSGGERALTAVALIFSILTISPPPFCFFDEVDAMLDEANVGRFRTMLESLTEHTQIVIITHNRGTISAADTVYGISMGADSVSQVVSLRLEDGKVKEV